MGKKSKTKNGGKKKRTANNNKAMENNLRTLETLKRLSQTLKELDESKIPTVEESSGVLSSCSSSRPSENKCSDNHKETIHLTTSLPLSHWREIPYEIETAYQMMHDGATLIHSTSTKYTLLTNIDPNESSSLTSELEKGANHICAAVLTIFDSSQGCGRSCRFYVKQAARSILSAVTAMINRVIEEVQEEKEKIANAGAQKTGVVWSCCDRVTQKKMPRGNRATMRRDLLTWIKECHETLVEFQERLDLGPRTEATNLEKEKEKEDDEDDWDDFCEDLTGEPYTQTDYDIVKPTLALIQISKGTIQCIMKACECIGEQVATNDLSPIQRTSLLTYLSTIHDMARSVGENMTDLGVLLYPPLELNTEDCQLFEQIKVQTEGLFQICDLILDRRELKYEAANKEEYIVNADLSEEVLEFAKKVRKITKVRMDEADAALRAARNNLK